MANFISGTLRVVFYVFCSISITLYNKFLFTTAGVRVPLSITAIHMLTNFVFSGMILRFMRGRNLPSLGVGWLTYFRQVVPIGVLTALDFGLSNVSLMIVALSFYAFLKTSGPAFALGFAIAFRLETFSVPLFSTVLTIIVGAALCLYENPAFSTIGLVLLCLALSCGGCRGALMQVVLQERLDTITLLYHMAPICFATLVPFAVFLEGKAVLEILSSSHSIPTIIFLILLGSLLSILLNVSEMTLVSYLSNLTYSIVAVAKDISLLVAAVIVLGEEVTLLNVMGFIVCLAGVIAYHMTKASNMTRKHGEPTDRVGMFSLVDGTDGEEDLDEDQMDFFLPTSSDLQDGDEREADEVNTSDPRNILEIISDKETRRTNRSSWYVFTCRWNRWRGGFG
eukprot:TRINITY_DN32203_c0_g1_i1.p1 TRINITY_DN32203_c0_g1~~TRINITY_DN32203_c0_g1_i1.p1  ORF type:complete len:396 (+),score=69.02 TRINITY_DN32203_c0_g1_i1:72-1259(+)